MATKLARFWTVIVLLLLCSAAMLYVNGGARLVGRVASYAVYAVVLMLPMFYFVLVTVLLFALPERPELTPVIDTTLPKDMAEIDAQLRDAGFRQVGPIALLNTRPRTRIVNYLNPGAGAYATIQKLRRNPPAFAFITPRSDLPGNLETLANPEVDALPEAPGVLRQVIHGQSVADLLQLHTGAMDFLGLSGVTFRPVTAQNLQGEMFAANYRQREAIWTRPFYSGWMVLWRSMNGRSPNQGSLIERAMQSSST